MICCFPASGNNQLKHILRCHPKLPVATREIAAKLVDYYGSQGSFYSELTKSYAMY